jgi:hypothetical protein
MITEPQRKLLSRAGISGSFDVHTGPQKRVAEHLLRKGFIRGGMLYPTAPHYRITDAGIKALEEAE